MWIAISSNNAVSSSNWTWARVSKAIKQIKWYLGRYPFHQINACPIHSYRSAWLWTTHPQLVSSTSGIWSHEHHGHTYWNIFKWIHILIWPDITYKVWINYVDSIIFTNVSYRLKPAHVDSLPAAFLCAVTFTGTDQIVYLLQIY